MASQVAEVAFSSKFAVEEESQGSSLPALQADDYKPGKKQKVNIVMNDTSWDLISDDVKENTPFTVINVDWDDGKGEQPMYQIDDARWVILSRPQIYNLNKQTNQVSGGYISDPNYGQNYKTVSRIALACLVGDELVKNDDGDLQIFTLKLTSTKTTWIKKESRSIDALNSKLKKMHKVKGNQWLCHLVSTEIEAYPHVAVSSKDGEKSNSTRFGFPEKSGARNLSEENCELTHALITSDEFKELAETGFGLLREGQEPQSEPVVITGTVLGDSLNSDANTAILEAGGERYDLSMTPDLLVKIGDINGEATISGVRTGNAIKVESAQLAEPIDESDDDDIEF